MDEEVLKKHEPMQIGTRDAEGNRTFAPPGDVCAACSDPETGLWVPVSQCPPALTVWEIEADRYIHPFAGFPERTD